MSPTLSRRSRRRCELIRAMGGQFSESRMLLHVALLLADEAADMRGESAACSPRRRRPAPVDPQLADRLARIAERIEGLAQSLDRP